MLEVELKPGERSKTFILIVDDVPQNLQVLVNILREKDYKISVATNGRKALEIIDRFLPDLILLDIMMPHKDGFQVCKQLKASPKTKDVPIIFLTAKVETGDIVKGFDLGAVDYVTKPFNKDELLARINTHLELRKAQKEIIRLEQKNAVLAVVLTANHELNQPLTVLQGNVELLHASLDKDRLTDRQKRFFTRIEKSIERIQAILKKMTAPTAVHFENYLDNKEMVIFEQNTINRKENQ